MIKKFIKISGTGKFLNYNYSSVPSNFKNTDFRQINLIYGENGCGKTTLSTILNSLKGDNALLTRRRSFNKSIPQNVELLTDTPANPKLTFSNKTWDSHYANIEVFDIHFINDNIYTGSEIQSNHKKNLFEVIFGQQGISLKLEIQKLKERIQKGNDVLKHTSEKLELAIDNAFKADKYCNLSVDLLIDEEIDAKKAEIVTAKDYQLIQQKPLLKPLVLLASPFIIEDGIAVIEKSIDNISEAFLLKVKTHKEHLNVDNPEDWLNQGLKATQNSTCPFCLRSIDETIDIINAYKQYFNFEYNALLKSLQTIQESIASYNLDALTLIIENGVCNNSILTDFWKDYLKDEFKSISFKSDLDEISALLNETKKIINSKADNPIQSKDSLSLKKLCLAISQLNIRIEAYNNEIDSYNKTITTLKTLKQINLPQLESQLKQLEAIKRLNDPTINSHCKEFKLYTSTIKNLKKEKDEKQILLESHSNLVANNFTSKINKYLKDFAPCLEIRKIKSEYKGSSKEPYLNYALHVDGNEIMMEDNQDYPSFKYSLSEGDKSALALAFFLTKLENDADLKNKIIVFDDPVSSFDLNRKNMTISKLQYFGLQAKQLFVLTHNIIFASEF